MPRTPLGKSLASAANLAAEGGLKITSWGFKNISRWAENDKELEDLKYDDLPPTPSIRLLKVEGRDGPRLICTLETFKLDSVPPYHALSYTWGDPFSLPNLEREPGVAQVAASMQQENYKGSPHKIVKCNGRRLRIGQNLFEALDQLRTQESSDLVPKEYLWADAICINQENASEKDKQILIMGEIYARASTVIVWLGKEQPGTEKAIRAISKLSKLKMSQLDAMTNRSIFEDSTYHALGIESVELDEWYAFFGFNRRGWFNRVWVVQELFFAKSHKYIAGNYRIAAEDLFQVGFLLKLSGWAVELEALLLPELWARIGNNAARPGAAVEIYLMKSEADKPSKLTPTHILVSTRAREATKQVDHIYALVNVIAVGLNVKTEDLPIKVDSSANLQDVMKQATLMCIQHDRDLTILSARQEQPPRGSWSERPSWIVDWSKRLAPTPLSFLSRFSWTPSGALKAEMPNTTLENALKFRAVKLCSVTRVSEHGQQMIDKSEFDSLFRTILSLTRYYAPGGQSMTEILWRTCVADCIEGTPAPARIGMNWFYLCIHVIALRAGNDKELFWRRLAEFETLVEELRSKDPSSIFPNRAATRKIGEKFISEPESEECMRWIQELRLCSHSFQETITGRRLAIADNSLVALVPRYAEPGDEVWAIPGIPALFALKRRNDGTHELLGEAYIHGAMYDAPAFIKAGPQSGTVLEEVVLK